MEKWANEYPSVRFLTVCVDSIGVAQQFAWMFGLNKVVNCHIPSREYLPVGYGQLGCSGFIVADEKGCFVSRKTAAFLQIGEAAFDYLENLLDERFGIKKYHNGREEKKSTEENTDVPVPSVGITSMDAEHDKCERALALLLAAPTIKALENALVELTAHFSHEEKLMKAYNFGKANSSDPFSPFLSHSKDHERILELGYDELARANIKAQNTMMQSTCSKTDKGKSE